MVPAIPLLNMHPKIKYMLKSEVAITLRFVAILHSLHSIIKVKKLLCMNPPLTLVGRV